MSQSKGNATPPGPEKKALRESREATVSRPGGFKNDPDDPTNPNEALERTHKEMRRRAAKGRG
jgi:hypothetical protein